ncbi:hypothetical protein, partial [Burkholderia gladioli]
AQGRERAQVLGHRDLLGTTRPIDIDDLPGRAAAARLAEHACQRGQPEPRRERAEALLPLSDYHAEHTAEGWH